MKTLGALLASSTLTIAGKKPQLNVFDLKRVNNVSNASELLLPAVPPEQLDDNRINVVSFLNLPATKRDTPYATEHAVKYILTTFIRARGGRLAHPPLYLRLGG